MTINKQPKAGQCNAMSGNTAAAGSVLQDLEDAIAKLRQDLDSLTSNFDKSSAKVNEELSHKATKEELADLQARLMQQLQDLIDQMRNAFADKDTTQKKFAALDKNVNFYFCISPLLFLYHFQLKNLYDMLIANQSVTK